LNHFTIPVVIWEILSQTHVVRARTRGPSKSHFSGKKIVSAPLMSSAKGHIIRPSIDWDDMGRLEAQIKDAQDLSSEIRQLHGFSPRDFRDVHANDRKAGDAEQEMARPERFELPTPRSVVWCSIQLSYGRIDRRTGPNAAGRSRGRRNLL
jgi:hypothetical protein